MDGRKAAFDILYKVEHDGAYASLALGEVLGKSKMSDEDKALATHIVYSVLQHKLHADYIIGHFASQAKKTELVTSIILRMAICQIAFSDKLPDYAVVSESVNLTKKIKKPYLSGFINGVLRSYIRKKAEIEYPKEKAQYLSIIYSYPLWQVKRWMDVFGEKAEFILQSGNMHPPMSLRVNTLKTTPEALIQKFENEKGIVLREGYLCKDALEAQKGFSVADDHSYMQGLYTPQDEASMMASVILDPQKGQSVIDMCASPGGKTTHMAQLMEGCGTITAFDVHPHKIKLIENSAKRLGIDIISANARDAALPDPHYENSADRVLVDAPCTGSGVLRRKPDMKWTRKMEDTKALCAKQYELLCTGALYVKEGGYLVYSTCSIDPAENEQIVQRFLSAHPTFEWADISTYLPKDKEQDKGSGCVTFMPGEYHADGFFIAKLMRKRIENGE